MPKHTSNINHSKHLQYIIAHIKPVYLSDESLYNIIKEYNYNNTNFIFDFFKNISPDNYYINNDRLIYFDHKTHKKYSLTDKINLEQLKYFIDNNYLQELNTKIYNNIIVSDILYNIKKLTTNFCLYNNKVICLDEDSYVDECYIEDNKLILTEEYKQNLKLEHNYKMYLEDIKILKRYNIKCD